MLRRLVVVCLGVALCLGAGACRKGTGEAAPAPGVQPAPSADAEAAPGNGKALTVFAGSASMPALEELAGNYEQRYGAKVDITSGGSGSVLTQFSQEQFGDVYIPGSDDFMDKAEAKDAVVKDTRTVLVYLIPAICVAKGNPKKVKAVADFAREDIRVVIGEPKAVCLGDIGKWILEETDLWSKVEPRIASYGGSCEDTLNKLLLGEADAIIGWDVFAKQQSDKIEAIDLPLELSGTRNIPAAVIKWSEQPEEAQALIDFLASDEAKGIWAKHGYALEDPSRGMALGGGV